MKMQINIPVNEYLDDMDDVKELVLAIINEANNRTFAVDSVTIDGIENFKSEKGFLNNLAKKRI